MTSYEKPTNELVDATLPMLSSPQHEAHFFARLENPYWIRRLRERRTFEHPPVAERMDGGGVRYPPWPPSRYLSRMAQHAPAEVAAIFASLKTDNVTIIGDMLQAALAMRPSDAATLVTTASRAARGGLLRDLNFTEACKLCRALAEADDVSSAMTLASALLAPKVDGEHVGPCCGDLHWYESELKTLHPILFARQPREFVEMLCDWLETATAAERGSDATSGWDLSYIWRPAIEDHSQNRPYDFSSTLVTSARNGFEQAIREGSMTLHDAFGILDRYTFCLFKRIRMHLINEFAETNPELVRRTIMDRKLFAAHEFKHEYARLVGRWFPLLSPAEREDWLGWIDAGPDLSNRADLSEEVRRDWVPYWKFERLHWVREHLENERKAFYEKMLGECGEPKLADLHAYHEFGWGHTSPMTVEELTKFGFAEAIERVCTWRPPTQRGLRTPEIEGLASTFEQYVGTEPERFSAQANLLIGRPAIFVRVFLGRMADAVKTGRAIDMSAVLDLCDWVIAQPVLERTTPVEADGPLADKDWQWARDEIAALVEKACEAEKEKRPVFPLETLRTRFWSLLDGLCRGPSQSNMVRNLAQEDPRVCDYLDLASNSPRGKAVEAALTYARWVANHIKTEHEGREIVPDGFKSMPEMREMLEWQLNPDNRSVAASAAIGAHVSLIYGIDKTWLGTNATRLFSLEGDLRSSTVASGWAAWNAFLVWVQPHVEFYRLFKPHYAFAVDQCRGVDVSKETREQPMFHLGQHLMMLYGRGQLELDDDQGLVRRFVTEAAADIRREAIGFVGRTLEGDEPVPEAVLNRFITLWDIYWSGPGRQDAKERPDARLFGAWFLSGKFPAQWALGRFAGFVEVVPTPQPDHDLGKRLAEACHADIAAAVRILDRMVRGDRDGWRTYSWRDSAREILDKAMRAGGEARTVATQLIDHLGRRGYAEFGTLLDVSP